MIQIRPVSDLRNKFPEIETLVNSGNPVYLTKNGYGAMVVLSLEVIIPGLSEPPVRTLRAIYSGNSEPPYWALLHIFPLYCKYTPLV